MRSLYRNDCVSVAEENNKSSDGGDVEEEGEHKDEKKPKPLHRTNSIFLRNLAPEITRSEIEAVSVAVVCDMLILLLYGNPIL